MQNDNQTHSRENFAAVAVAIGAALACFTVLLLIGFGYAFALVAGVGIMALIGAGHYFIWGKAERRRAVARREDNGRIQM